MSITPLKQQLKQNEEVLHILPFDDLVEEWRHCKWKNTKTAAGLVSPARDAMTAIKICSELGITGQVALTAPINGSSYVIIKGYPGLRPILTGTRYLETNIKVVKMAIGRIGVGVAVAEGAVLTIILYAGIDILEYILDDHATLSLISAKLATDLMKVGISAIAATAVGVAIGTTATIAALPLVIAVILGTATNYILDNIDERYQLTEKLAAALDDCIKKIEDSFGHAYHDIEKSLIWRLYHFDIDKLHGH